MNSLGMKNLIETKNNSNMNSGNDVNSMKNANDSSVKKDNTKNEDSNIINELNGVIVNLDRIIQKKIQNKDINISNEVILYYAYALLDLAYIKKYCISMQKKIGKTVVKKNNIKLN